MLNKPPTKKLVKAARKKLKITSYEAARRIGLSSMDFVSMVESGARLFDLGRLPAVSSALDIPLTALIGAYLRESKAIPKEAKDALIAAMVPEQPEWQLKLEALNPESHAAVIEAIDTLHDRQVRDFIQKGFSATA